MIRGFFLFAILVVFAPLVGGIALLNICLRPTSSGTSRNTLN